jgi:hypothetical protein
MIKYIRNSNVKISIDLNPFYWRFHYASHGPTDHDPKLRIWWFQFLFINFWIMVDDGTFILDPLEQIEVEEEEEYHT